MVGKNLFPNGSIRCARSSTIDGAQHFSRSLSALSGEPRIGGNALPSEGHPEPRESTETIGRQFVEQDQSAKRLLACGHGQISVKALPADTQSHHAVGGLADNVRREAIGRDRLDAISSELWAEDDDRRIDPRRPENGLSQC